MDPPDIDNGCRGERLRTRKPAGKGPFEGRPLTASATRLGSRYGAIVRATGATTAPAAGALRRPLGRPLVAPTSLRRDVAATPDPALHPKIPQGRRYLDESMSSGAGPTGW
jgi:hypothetical protein